MAKKLLAKAGLIHLPPAPVRSAAEPDTVNSGPVAAALGGPGVVAETDTGRAKTAPGSMLQFMSAQSAAVKEAEVLRERLAVQRR